MRERKSITMFKQITRACALAALLAAAAAPASAAPSRYFPEDWASQIRLLASAGYNATGVINTLTFRDGTGQSGWNWQLQAAYPLQDPFFVEGGLMGWTLDRDGLADAKRFGIAGAVGLKLGGGSTETGFGLIPSGTRIFLRHFLNRETPGKGPMAQLAIAFPGTTGTRSYADISIGYGF